MPDFTDFLHIFFFLIDFNTKSWHLTSSSYCWMAEILLLLWQWSFPPLLLLGNLSLLYLFTSPCSSVPFLVCLTFCSSFFPYFLFALCAFITWRVHLTCVHKHINTINIIQEHTNTKKLLANNKKTGKKQQITAHKNKHTHVLSLPCCLTVCLYPLLGVLQLFVTPPPLQYTSPQPVVTLTAATTVRTGLLLSATVACSALCSATICNPVTQQPPYDRLTISTVCKVNSRHQSGKWRCNSI